MSLVVPNTAEATMLKYTLNAEAPEDLVIRLYSNDIIPSQTDSVTDYTEVTGGGYAAQNLIAGAWIVTEGNPSTATHPLVTWVFTAAVGNVYGYYITRQTTGDLFWAERFLNAPYNIQNVNDEIRVTPKISLNNVITP